MIFYFSGTGNTKWAAKHVAARLNEELKFIPDELSTDMAYTVNPGESIGFIIPEASRADCRCRTLAHHARIVCGSAIHGCR